MLPGDEHHSGARRFFLQGERTATTRVRLEAARDTAWAIASPESYDLLVRQAGHSQEEFELWMDTTLTAALLA